MSLLAQNRAPARGPLLPRQHLIALLLPVMLGLVAPLRAQAPEDPTRVIVWFAGGPALVLATMSPPRGLGIPEGRGGLVAVSTLQARHLVISTRLAVAGTGPVSAWDAGLLVGIGSSTVPPVYGSVAAGVGATTAPGRETGLSFPVELQVGWRLTSNLGLGLYGFGSFGGPDDFVGLSLAARVGRLR